MRRTLVPPEGLKASASYIIVGEQPGKKEVMFGKPFVGPSGKLLDELMLNAGIARSECYITNTIKDLDHTLDYYAVAKRGHIAFTNHGQEYVQELKEELETCPANIIIAIGNIALSALASRYGITKWRGSVIESTLVPGKMVIPVIHPATVLPPKKQYLNKHLIQHDLKRARKVCSEGWHPVPDDLIIGPSYGEIIVFLENCYHLGLTEGATIAFDIELYNEEVSCISVSYDRKISMSIPFINSDGDIFTPDQELDIWLLIAKILEDPRIYNNGQNLGFDSHFLLRRYGIHVTNFDDTMIAQKTLMPEYPMGLDFITSIWTMHPYYKDEGKRWFKSGGKWEELWQYNATDSLICQKALPHQLDELAQQKNLAAYFRQVKVVEPLTYMEEHGIKVDVEGMKKYGQEIDKELSDLQSQLDELSGMSLNINSPKQLKDYFYVKKGLKPYKSKSGSISVDKDALKRLIRKGVSEAKIISDMRKLAKLRSTYLPADAEGNLAKVDPDGRIRCSYNPVGTMFSRLSSSENIFGTGMNMQNWPDKALQFLLPDEGYIYYSFDLSQAENRMVAYIGQIAQMIHAFETGKDVHKLTASLIFGKPYEEISDKDGSCSLGGGEHSERFWGKKANHGLNYDLGYRNFAFYYEIPETEGKFIVERYHQAYPGVRNGYHAYVKLQLQRNRTVVNLMGRRTTFLDEWSDKLFKKAYSCNPQGSTGDVINERGINYIYYNQGLFAPIELLNQIHDSIGFQIPLSTGWREQALMLTLVRRSLETPLSIHGRDFSIPADLTMGLNLAKSQGIEMKGDNFPRDVEELAVLLESNYNALLKNLTKPMGEKDAEASA